MELWLTDINRIIHHKRSYLYSFIYVYIYIYIPTYSWYSKAHFVRIPEKAQIQLKASKFLHERLFSIPERIAKRYHEDFYIVAFLTGCVFPVFRLVWFCSQQGYLYLYRRKDLHQCVLYFQHSKDDLGKFGESWRSTCEDA